jgi:glutathione peroxidase
MAALYDYTVQRIDGTPMSMGEYRGTALLVVNVASNCGFTPQYTGLEALHRKYQRRGFAVLGFPCNQFGAQEPGTEAQIGEFCSRNYDVTFPLFAKVDVNGDQAHPLFEFLKAQQPGALGTKSIKWNFTKFLVGPDGSVLKRYASATMPAEIDADVAVLVTAA